MVGRLVIPLDGSTLSERALHYGIGMSKASNSRLVLLRVLTPRPQRGEALVQEPEALAALEQLASGARAQGVEVDVEVSSTLFGDIDEVIVDTARRTAVDMIVMSTHGRTGLRLWTYGSVAEKVLGRASIPVLVIPAADQRTWPTDRPPRVLLTLDGSPLSAQAIEPTCLWAAAIHAEVLLVHVLTSPREDGTAVATLEAAAATFRAAALPVTLHTPVGEAAVCIAELAREKNVDVIAMATHGRSGAGRAILGSVATETLHRAELPMFLVRAPRPTLAALPELQQPLVADPSCPMKLLVPLDLTSKASVLLPEVARLARAADADVLLLNVFIPAVELDHVSTESRTEATSYLCAERRRYLDLQALQLPCVRTSTRVEALGHGEAIDEAIARVATEIHADLVVLASARVGRTIGVTAGSFTSGVLRLSPCPVVIVNAARAPLTMTTGMPTALRKPARPGW